MNLQQIAVTLGLQALTPALVDSGRVEISQAHASDLLSDVLANAPAGGLLLTIQVHLNVIAVAMHAGQAAVIFTSGMVPEDGVIDRAVEETGFACSNGKKFSYGNRAGRCCPARAVYAFAGESRTCRRNIE